MRWFWLVILIGALSASSTMAAPAEQGRIVKVLPQFLDTNGVTTISPSLYDRDAYQKQLRLHPRERSGIQFAVQWKANTPPDKPLILRAELRGIAAGDLPKQMTLEATVYHRHWFNSWTDLKLVGDAYRDFGEVTAWRVTLWDGNTLVSEQKSFLW